MDIRRIGVSHSCMVELHRNVAHIRNHPAMNEAATIKATDSVMVHNAEHAIIAVRHIMNPVRAENLNFNRNITQKLIDIPTSCAYPAIRMSCCIRALSPTISVAAARYRPPENWMIMTQSTNIQGLSRRGMLSVISGMSNGPFRTGPDISMVFYIPRSFRHAGLPGLSWNFGR